MELIGADTAQADAEVIALATDMLNATGVTYDLKVGHLSFMRNLLRDLEYPAPRRMMAFLDKKDFDGLKSTLESMNYPDLGSSLISLVECRDLAESFEIAGTIPEKERIIRTLENLDAAGVSYSLNFGIARGLDYYTGMVFEGFAENLGAENQILGGGAYRLAHLFGGDDVASCGFAIGFDRVMVSLGELRQEKDTVVAIVFTDEGRRHAQKVAGMFRAAGIRSEMDLMERGLGAQLAHASRSADFAVVVGLREAESGTVTLRNLQSGEQKMLDLPQPSPRCRLMVLADELAKQQRSISVAEFFEKNKHLLGFDSPTRGVITTIKEAVDNALDACEEAQVLPDIFISIKKVTNEIFRIIVEDNGPGIVPAQVPFVFGKLLYGSRFHQIRQTRGQQGIGISAAVRLCQLTSGVPAVVISRTGPKESAHRFEIQIRIETNEPDIISQGPFEWDRIHGTRVQIEFRSTMSAKKKLLEYLRYTSVVNPHARLRVELDEESFTFERVSQEVIACPVAILPHPHGIEFGQLKRMASSSDLTLIDFLVESFSRVGKKSAQEMCERAGTQGKPEGEGTLCR